MAFFTINTRFFYCLILTLGCLVSANAQGILKGQVKDKKTGQTLPGATIFIIGSYKGAAADMDGNFSIKDIKAGDYSVKVSFVGYVEKIFTGIRIKKDEQTLLNISLNEQGRTLEAVEIVGNSNMIDLEDGKSQVRISSADIEQMNVRNVQDVVAMQGGVTQTPDGLQIRGGRVYETQYVVDGVSAADPLAGTGFGAEVASNAVQDISLITGGADAEYNGTSGIVLTRIKEGGNKVGVSGSWQRDNLGFNTMSGAAWNTDIVQAAIGGPVAYSSGKLKFYTNMSVNMTDTYFRLRANQLQSSIMSNDAFWAPRQDNKWANTIKLSWQPSAATKISLTNQHSIGINQNTRTLQIIGFDQIMMPGLQYNFSQNLDNATTYTHRVNLTAINLQHRISNQWTTDVTLGRLFTNMRADANGRLFRNPTVDRIYDPQSIVSEPIQVFNPDAPIVFVLPGNGLINNGGISTIWHDHYVEEYTVKYKFSFISSNKKHFLSFGQEHKQQHLQWIDVTRPWVGAPLQLNDGSFTPSNSIGSSNDVWETKPITGGFFVQDEIRYNGILATIGTRFEYWAPGQFADNAVADPNAPVLPQIRKDYLAQSAKFLGTRFKARLLPKIRVSFPITENNVLSFNYGHAMRLPHPRFVYAGLDAEYQNRSFLSSLGNPNLNPEVAVSYELAYKSQITRDFGFTVTAFYKDYFDFIVNRSIIVRDRTGRFVEKTFAINQDYARIRGLEILLNYRLHKWLRTSFNASFQVATGKSNTAAESLLQIRQNGAVNTTKEQFLAWDRPYDFKGSLIFVPDTSVSLLGMSLNRFRAFLSLNYKSGLRYTPHRVGGVSDLGRPMYEPIETQPNTRIGSSWFWADIRLSRDLSLGAGRILSFTIEINNAFNNKNAQLINPVTGTAYRAGDALPFDDRDPNFQSPQDRGLPPTNPARWMAPRQILYGLSFNF